MDRAIITGMVEDYWRAFIPGMQTGDPKVAIEIAERFEGRVAATAKLLGPIDAAAFQQTIEAERERLMAEYQADPIALKKRLGIALGIDGPRQATRRGNGIGDLAVRTAVRATVWESIWALFRAAR